MLDFLHQAARAFLYPGGWYLLVRVVTASYAVSAVGRLIPVRRKQVAGYRGRPGRTAALSAGGLAVACALVTWTYVVPQHRSLEHSAVSTRSTTSPGLGVFEPNEWETWAPVERFASAVGRNPGIVLLYSGWPEPWQAKFAAMAYAHGAEPFVQIEPVGVTLNSIVAGRSDAYLRSYAASVRRYGHPVILSFGAEMNGSWYSWGSGHTRPDVFVAAWRHVVSVFRRSGARNVRWLWTVNSTNATAAPLKRWWPGNSYVNIVGIDGYYYRRADTFESVFGTTITEVRRFTRTPILISETATGPVAGPAKIADLFAGVREYHLLGLVWFDETQHHGIYHQDWRLEDSPAALGAFRKAVDAREERVIRSKQKAADTRRPAGRDRSVPPTARAMGPAIRVMAPAQLTPAVYQNDARHLVGDTYQFSRCHVLNRVDFNHDDPNGRRASRA